MRLVLLLTALLMSACASYRDRAVPMTAQAVDPERYVGLWYEIARFPVVFQDGCTGVTAEYGVIDAGTLSVVNSCRADSLDGPLKRIAGTAEAEAPGQFTVRLEGVPVGAPYWVLWVDDSYDTAVVGVPSGRAGWVLARTPQIDPTRLETARGVLAANGYDTDRLQMTPQLAR